MKKIVLLIAIAVLLTTMAQAKELICFNNNTYCYEIKTMFWKSDVNHKGEETTNFKNHYNYLYYGNDSTLDYSTKVIVNLNMKGESYHYIHMRGDTKVNAKMKDGTIQFLKVKVK